MRRVFFLSQTSQKWAQHLTPLLLVLTLAACNLDQAALPTPNDQNLIFVTATGGLPTANAEGVVVITATPPPSLVTESGANPLFTPVVGAVDVPVQNGSTDANSVAQNPIDPASVGQNPPVNVAPVENASTESLMTQARLLAQQGYFERAVEVYQSVLNQGDAAPAPLRAEAAYRLGRAALKDGLFDQAVTAFTLLISQFPQDALTPGAYFLRGDAYLGLSQWQPAISDYQTYLTAHPGLIDSYVYERVGDAQLSLGQTEAALQSYQQAVNTGRTLVPLLVLREKIAKIFLGLNRTNEAVAQYDAILTIAKNAPYRASIDFAAAKAILDSGDNAAGLARVNRVFNEYMGTQTAYLALQTLTAKGIEIDGYKRGKVSYLYGDYQGAIDAFNDYSSNFPISQIPADLYLQLGRAYREIGNPAAAVVAFQSIVQNYPTDPLFGEALLEQGRTRFLSNDIPGAIQSYLGVARDYSSLPNTAAEALWRAGYLYGTNGDPTRSREIFLQMAEKYPNNTWTVNGLFLAASAAMSTQEWAAAETLYGRLTLLTSGEEKAGAYLWLGRLAQQRNDSQGAEAAFDQAIAAAPDSYFAARAADIRLGRAPFQAPTQVRFAFDEVADKAVAEEWLRRTFPAITQTGDLSTLSTTLAADSRFVRGNELWAMGANTDALQEFTAILDEARAAGDALTSYQLALYFRDQGAYLSSIVAGADVINAAKVATLDAPPFIARLRYPAYYHELVSAEAADYGFDPLLMIALTRQESLFDATATSVADARGLTQVMPATGQYIAGSLGMNEFRVSDLNRPYIGVRFGAFYLAEQLRLFNGNAAAALAAYNAGPGRVLDWYKLSGGEMDLFVTTIPFEETRLYIERIYGHYAMYRALYGE